MILYNRSVLPSNGAAVVIGNSPHPYCFPLPTQHFTQIVNSQILVYKSAVN